MEMTNELQNYLAEVTPKALIEQYMYCQGYTITHKETDLQSDPDFLDLMTALSKLTKKAQQRPTDTGNSSDSLTNEDLVDKLKNCLEPVDLAKLTPFDFIEFFQHTNPTKDDLVKLAKEALDTLVEMDEYNNIA